MEASSTDGVTRERARSLVQEAMFTVALQCRRLRSGEKTLVSRWWADLQFLIVALRRMRRAAEWTLHTTPVVADVERAIRAFDGALPGLRTMRNIGDPVDAANEGGARQHGQVERGVLELGTWDGATYHWLGQDLNVDVALAAAEALRTEVLRALR